MGILQNQVSQYIDHALMKLSLVFCLSQASDKTKLYASLTFLIKPIEVLLGIARNDKIKKI